MLLVAASAIGDTDRLVAAALANDRGFVSSVGAIDGDKVEILEMALKRLSTDKADRALVLATLCSELANASPLERRQALADEALAIAQSFGDDAVIVRVILHAFLPLFVPPLLGQSLAWSADAMVRAERVGDPVLLTLAATDGAIAAARATDIDEMDRCLGVMESTAEQLDQPTLNWMSTFHRAARATLAGDTDLAEQLAVEALQIGTDGGEPDATMIFGATLMIVSLQRGTLGELVPLIEQTAADNPGIPTFVALLAMAPQKVTAPMRRVSCWMSSQPQTLISPWTGSGSPEWLTTPKPQSSAGTQSTPGRCSTGSHHGPIIWLLPVAQPPKGLSAISSAVLPPSLAATKKQTPTSLKRPISATEWVQSSSPPVRTSSGDGCSPNGTARATPRELGSFSPRRTPPQRPMGMGTWSDAPP